MQQILPALAAGAVALALAVAPAISASAAPEQTAARAPKAYTLTVDGNGSAASIVWMTAKVKSGETPTPSVHTVTTAKEPWKKRVSATADLVEVVAVQTTGSRLSCTIKNPHGTVVARSTSRGKNSIVTCIVSTSALLTSGIGGSTGTTAG